MLSGSSSWLASICSNFEFVEYIRGSRVPHVPRFSRLCVDVPLLMGNVFFFKEPFLCWSFLECGSNTKKCPTNLSAVHSIIYKRNRHHRKLCILSRRENCSSCRCLEALWSCTSFLSVLVFRSLAELFNQATDSGSQFPFDLFRVSMSFGVR